MMGLSLHSVVSVLFIAQQGAGAAGEIHVAEKMTAVIASIFVFVLAIFIGFEIITKVPATLHTPLMSGSNAISGITVVGALIASDSESLASFAPALGFLAIIFATINVIGGFMVTDRMLKMFQKR